MPLVDCYYGLRVHEVALMIWSTGISRSDPESGTKPPAEETEEQLVLPFDVPGREGEGERLRGCGAPARFASQVALNRINEIETKGLPAGDEIRQLERFKFWQGLQAAHPGLSVYSLRQSVYRMHKSMTARYQLGMQVRCSA